MRTRTLPLLLALLTNCLAITDARSAWSPDGNRVSHSPGFVTAFAAIPGGAGGALVAWSSLEYQPLASRSRAFLQSLDAHGEVTTGWPVSGVPLSDGAGYQSAVSLATDGSSGAFASWYEQGPGGAELFLQHIGADGVRFAGWPASGRRLANVIGSPAALSADGAGGVFVGWAEPAGTDALRQRAIRMLADGAVASGWPAEGIDLGLAANATPALAPDGAGGAIVTWSEALPAGGNSRLRVHRLTANGAFDSTWPAGGTVLAESLGFIELSLASDRGGVFVAWAGGPYACPAMAANPLCADCYCPSDQIVSHVDAAGRREPGWPAGGLRLGDFGRITTAPAGGLIAATIQVSGSIFGPPSYRHRPFTRALVRRLDASGAPLPGWTHGANVSTEARYPQGVDAISDGGEGVFATWIDHRTGESVLYVTRLSATGSIAQGWPESGSLAALGAVRPFSPLLVPAGARGAIVLWLDSRHGNWQVYADEVVAGPPGPTAPLDVVPYGSAGFGIRRVWPNPSRAGFEVMVELPEAAPATLEVFDVSGRSVFTERFDFAGPARGSVRLNRDRRLEPGIYWLRLRQGPRSASQRIITIR